MTNETPEIQALAGAMYLAQDAVATALHTHGRGSDEWINARMAAGDAQHAYEEGYARKMGGYVETVTAKTSRSLTDAQFDSIRAASRVPAQHARLIALTRDARSTGATWAAIAQAARVSPTTVARWIK